MRQGVIALLSAPFFLALSGCLFVGPVTTWDGVYNQKVHVKVISADLQEPVENAAVTWFCAGYDESHAKRTDALTFEGEQSDVEFRNAHMQTAVTGPKGQCELTLLLGFSGTSRRVLFWHSNTSYFGINGTLQVQAEGFVPLRKPLLDLAGAKEGAVGNKTPIEIVVSLKKKALP